MKNKKLYRVTSLRKGSNGRIIRYTFSKEIVAESPKQAREKFVAATNYRGEFVVSYHANIL